MCRAAPTVDHDAAHFASALILKVWQTRAFSYVTLIRNNSRKAIFESSKKLFVLSDTPL